MNFIEVTDRNDRKAMINIDLVTSIEIDIHNNNSVFLTFPSESYFYIKESYDELKEIIKECTNGN